VLLSTTLGFLLGLDLDLERMLLAAFVGALLIRLLLHQCLLLPSRRQCGCSIRLLDIPAATPTTNANTN